MDHRRGRRPFPRPFRRRAATSTVLLILAASGAYGAIHSIGGWSATSRASLPAPAASETPEDDIGAFVDPTPPATPAAAEAAQRPTPPVGPSITIPVLLYHYVRVNPVASDQVGFELSVTPPNFAAQMAFLQWAGVHTVSLGDVLQALRTHRPLPPRSVVLTFDDGYADFARVAAPVMQHDGLHGTVFVVSGFVGRNGYMNATQVREVEEMGMVIGCHTVNHVDLAAAPLSVARTQIDVAHQQLRALTGQPVLDFAYPYGGFNAAVEGLVAADGFRDAVTTEPGAVLSLAQPFAWPRYRVGGHDTLLSFAHKALFGMSGPRVDALVHSYLASPAAALATRALPTPPGATAMGDPQGEDSRRYL
jgi:peptidoglycan/xylan/chitin deacetylase (PgdA/CDA1 family)